MFPYKYSLGVQNPGPKGEALMPRRTKRHLCNVIHPCSENVGKGAPAVDVRDRKEIMGLNAVTYRKLVKRVPAEVMSVTSSALHSRSPTAAARGQICTKQALQWSHMRQAILQFAVQYLWYNVSCIGKLRPHCRLAANDQCLLRGTE